MFKKFKSNQYYALVVLVFSFIYVVLGFNMPEAFYSDPIGPNLWIKIVGAVLIIFSLILIIIPGDYQGDFPQLKQWLKVLPLLASISIYYFLLPISGFLITTMVLVAAIARFFGAKLLFCIIAAIIMVATSYFIFDFALKISLPTGTLWT